ncbi:MULTISPECIES: heme exporter protein CcmD [unclassified Paracoccus (in: a-proteobacteria)]|nr:MULTISPECIES: heme exporter protein CcmD [unclassified Paracoccus (in: a-proteobacteria)]UXU74531.1 heme exporter protein CcmD [Paracoccus sp. SMMA_5]UXU80424.1 heme exporter protein CcmD [Paracoccus sp. SMMA_5_TC]
MIDLGKYAGTVLAAYGVSLLLLVGVIVQSALASRRARRALEEFEDRG